MHKIYIKYQEALKTFPVPGTGGGSHSALLSCANYARMAGRSKEEAIEEIFEAIPVGRKKIPLRDLEEAVAKAYDSQWWGSSALETSSKRCHKDTCRPDLQAFLEG